MIPAFFGTILWHGFDIVPGFSSTHLYNGHWYWHHFLSDVFKVQRGDPYFDTRTYIVTLTLVLLNKLSKSI